MYDVPAGGSVPGLRPAKGYGGGGIRRKAAVVGLRGLPRLVCLLHANGAPHNEACQKTSANRTKEGQVKRQIYIYCQINTKIHLCLWREIVLEGVNIKTCFSLVSGPALAFPVKDLSLHFSSSHVIAAVNVTCF